MGQPRARGVRPQSSELVERGDIDALTVYVNDLVAAKQWGELGSLRERCQLALQRGKQLWAVAAYIEYRLCLEAPGDWAALMLESGTGRFAFGPLPEVAASTHTWSELSPHLHPTPQAAMAAHERVVRGEDLTADETAAGLPEVLDVPLRLEEWEPAYALAEYHPDRLEAPPPKLPPLQAATAPPSERLKTGPSRRENVGAADGNGRGSGRARADDVTTALEELVSAWTAESNGRAEAVSVAGTAVDAVSALGARLSDIVELSPADALAAMAWAAADGGAHGRRRGAAPGRFGAWWVVGALGRLIDAWPPPPNQLREVLDDVRCYAWGSGDPVTGWALRLAIEARQGPQKGQAWAISATDAA